MIFERVFYWKLLDSLLCIFNSSLRKGGSTGPFFADSFSWIDVPKVQMGATGITAGEAVMMTGATFRSMLVAVAVGSRTVFKSPASSGLFSVGCWICNVWQPAGSTPEVMVIGLVLGCVARIEWSMGKKGNSFSIFSNRKISIYD